MLAWQSAYGLQKLCLAEKDNDFFNKCRNAQYAQRNTVENNDLINNVLVKGHTKITRTGERAFSDKLMWMEAKEDRQVANVSAYAFGIQA